MTSHRCNRNMLYMEYIWKHRNIRRTMRLKIYFILFHRKVARNFVFYLVYYKQMKVVISHSSSPSQNKDVPNVQKKDIIGWLCQPFGSIVLQLVVFSLELVHPSKVKGKRNIVLYHYNSQVICTFKPVLSNSFTQESRKEPF